MQDNKPRVLCTRPLDKSLIQYVQQHNIDIDAVSFIHINRNHSEEVSKKIIALAEQKITAVFTSANAVEAVADKLTAKPNWDVYCIGGNTKKTISDKLYNKSIKGFADTAKELSKIIIKHHPTGIVYFFCGDKRMDYLPKALGDRLIDVEEVTVYKTEQLEVKVDKEYDGIIFFSPSGVKSFFAVNKIKEEVVLFAIGDTTADAITQYSDNEIVVSDYPDAKEMMSLVIEELGDRSQEN